MGRLGVLKRIGRQLSGMVRAGHITDGAVVRGEIVEHPETVEDPETTFVWHGAHVGVQRLGPLTAGIDTAGVEAAELEMGAENMAGVSEEVVPDHQLSKQVVLVGQVGQSPTARLGLELASGGFSLGFEEFLEPGGNPPRGGGVTETRQCHTTDFIELVQVCTGRGHLERA